MNKNNQIQPEHYVVDFYLQIKSVISMNATNNQKHAILDKIFCKVMNNIDDIYLK